jgi:hypothetical protein
LAVAADVRAGPGEIERQLKLLQCIGSAHAAVGFQLHDRIVVFQRRDVGGNLIEIGDQLDGRVLVAAHERQRAIQRVERLLHHMRLLLRVFVGRDPAGREVGRRILRVIEDGARFT